MSKELDKVYNPKKSEENLYEKWEKSGYFRVSENKNKKPFTIVMPPPNITGNLHMGHALDETLQDIIIRFKRMQGYNALWIPGSDHASIATEAKIVEKMREEGVTKQDIGRDGFLKRAWEWKHEYGGNIIKQIKKLGASCDWTKERFTMDEGCSRAVREFFVRLYEKGLIYRGEKIINWCPNCKTSISDSEVDFKEKDGNFWHIRYKLSDNSGFVEVATTRPETMFGDVALAVNPNDERYKDLVNKKVVVPVVGREIPIITDEYVDMEVGTGVLKITPAHDPNDFEVGVRHKLPVINVMDETAHMNENAGKYCGLERYKARKLFVEELTEAGCISAIKPIKHNVGTCYRCSHIVEPRISTQWFVKMADLAKPAIECVKSGKTTFVPERFSKIYYHWMENIKDWCISRQLWWGHRIPAWYCQDCQEIIVSREDVCKCPKCSSSELIQEEDTLDTWFSSGLWPFAVLGWPNKTDELEYFFPTNVLVTGYDIIFFWVAKMIFSSLEVMGAEPFEHVLIHGLVRDSLGRKMSKSLGNGVDPLEMIEKYGADALRFSLVMGNSPGNDMRFFTQKVESCRNFANKIWNAARFVHMNTDGLKIKPELPKDLELADKWIVSRFNKTVQEVSNNLEKFEFGVASQKLYDFIWDEFCDWYIEFSKICGKKEVLVWVLKNTMKLLHPFMPFITEEIWCSFEDSSKSLMTSSYPKTNMSLIDEEAEKNANVIMSVIKSVRNIRSEMNVPKNKKVTIYVKKFSLDVDDVLKNHCDVICRLASAKSVEFNEEIDTDTMITVVNDYVKIFIPSDELVNKEAESVRLKKELNAAQAQLEQAESRLKDSNFISKAPKKIVDGAKENAQKLRNKIEQIKKSIPQ